MKTPVLIFAAALLAPGGLPAQAPDMDLPDAPMGNEATAVRIDEPVVKKGALAVVYSGNTVFTAAVLRNGLAQQYTNVETFGLNEASAYDVAFFLQAYY